MKHLAAVNEVLRITFFEDWMDEGDYQEFVDIVLKEGMLTRESLSNDLEIGVQNGHSIEDQIDMLKIVLKLKKERSRTMPPH